MKSRISWEIIVIGVVIIGYSIYFWDWNSPEDVPEEVHPLTTDTHSAPIQQELQPMDEDENITTDSFIAEGDITPSIVTSSTVADDRDQHEAELIENPSPVAYAPAEIEQRGNGADSESTHTALRESDWAVEDALEDESRERMTALGELLTSVGSAVDVMSGAGEFNNRFNEDKASLISEEHFPAFALASVDVNIETGHIQLATHSGSDVIVQVWVADRNQSGEFERFYRTVITKNPESVLVRIERKQRDEHWTSRLQRLWATDVSNSITAGVRVLVPEGGLTYSLHTQSGNIEAMHAGGDITLETRAGNLLLEGLFGRTVAETRAGNIRASNISGTTALRTRAGNIQADNIRANTELRTRAGNISATIHSVNQRIDAESRVGNVTLTIPSEMKADISIDGSNASLDESFSFDGERASQYIRGTINGGGPLVRVHARVGNSSVRSHTE